MMFKTHGSMIRVYVGVCMVTMAPTVDPFSVTCVGTAVNMPYGAIATMLFPFQCPIPVSVHVWMGITEMELYLVS